jgi:hypothetical protein
MTQSEPEDANVSLSEEEAIELARRSLERHCRQETYDDMEHGERWRRIGAEAPPPQSRIEQAWISISYAWRQFPWDWRAPIKNPYTIALILAAMSATATIVLLVVLNVPLTTHGLKPIAPETHSTTQTPSDSGISSTPSPSPSPAYSMADETTGQGVPDTPKATRPAEGDGGPSQRPAANSPTGKPLTIDVAVGSTSGAFIDLDVTLTGSRAGTNGLQTDLGVTVDPASAVCSLTHSSTNSQGLSQLLAGVTAPVQAKIPVRSGRLLVIQLSPTENPTRPLDCTVQNPDDQPQPSASADSPAPPPGAVGEILGSVSSLALLPQR